MAEEGGEENFFLFGLSAQQVADSRGWYSSYWHYHNDPETRAALDLISSDYFSRYEPGIFAPIHDALLAHGDHYMHLADLKSYLDADRRLCELHADQDQWARKAILNIAGSGIFERPHHRSVRRRDLEREIVSGSIAGRGRHDHFAARRQDSAKRDAYRSGPART